MDWKNRPHHSPIRAVSTQNQLVVFVTSFTDDDMILVSKAVPYVNTRVPAAGTPETKTKTCRHFRFRKMLRPARTPTRTPTRSLLSHLFSTKNNSCTLWYLVGLEGDITEYSTTKTRLIQLIIHYYALALHRHLHREKRPPTELVVRDAPSLRIPTSMR